MTERLEAASGPVAQFGRGRRLRSGVLQDRILLGPLSEFARVRASAVAVAQPEERGPPTTEVEGSIPSRSADLKTEPVPVDPEPTYVRRLGQRSLPCTQTTRAQLTHGC